MARPAVTTVWTCPQQWSNLHADTSDPAWCPSFVGQLTGLLARWPFWTGWLALSASPGGWNGRLANLVGLGGWPGWLFLQPSRLPCRLISRLPGRLPSQMLAFYQARWTGLLTGLSVLMARLVNALLLGCLARLAGTVVLAIRSFYTSWSLICQLACVTAFWRG